MSQLNKLTGEAPFQDHRHGARLREMRLDEAEQILRYGERGLVIFRHTVPGLF